MPPKNIEKVTDRLINQSYYEWTVRRDAVELIERLQQEIETLKGLLRDKRARK
jgi:hypothetical protein